MQGVRRTKVKAPWALAVVALGAGALLTAFAPQPYVGLPLLAASPLVAGALLPFRFAAGFLGAALAVSAGLDSYRGRAASALVVDLAVIGLIGVLGLAVNVLMERQERDLARARDIAEAVQVAVLPQPATHVGGLAVAAGYTAAEAEARIGGDLFAVQATPFGVRMVIGDVRGKGMQAVGTVSVAIGAFRQEAEHAPDLAALAERMDEALSRDTSRRPPGVAAEDFTTAVLAEVSPAGDVLRLVNRGHPPPYLVHEGNVTRLDPRTPQLPLGMGLGAVAPSSATDTPPADVLPLPSGAFLLMITDGVTEARNRDGVFYDPCRSRLTGQRFADPAALVDAVTADVHRWTHGGQQDDMAILAATREAAEGR